MIESLDDLASQLGRRKGVLSRLSGIAHEVIDRLIESEAIDAVFLNLDYTPFSRSRDERIEEVCRRRGIDFVTTHDALLHAPGDVMTGAGEPYSVFTPFFRNAVRQGAPAPEPLGDAKFAHEPAEGSLTDSAVDSLLTARNASLHVQGGRRRAMQILETIGRFSGYAVTRDTPANRDGTTSLSAYLKFGCVSAREVRDAVSRSLGANHELIRQLHWRDFFTHLAFFNPHVFGRAFRAEYDAVEWDDDRKRFDRWRAGETGFPIVDAGMRQLAETGWMHNRVRMIVASFLTKDLHIDWRMGERHFARSLVDYDPAVNNGSWQWAASTGADAQPYFRIFNPWLQQKKFDPEAKYIHRWIPELRDLDAKSIQALAERQGSLLSRYPSPMVDHAMEKERTIRRFERVR